MTDRPPHVRQPVDTVLADLRARCGVTLNAAQARRLAWIMARKGPPRFWPETGGPDGCRLAIVAAPPNGTQLELLRHTLAGDAVVVVPCGEDPAYDPLKAHLVAFGTVGTEGGRGPHQMWWGGFTWDALALPVQAGDEAVITSPSPPLVPDSAAERMSGIDEDCGEISAFSKAAHILSVWQASARPVLWSEAGTEQSLSALPGATACDFAVCKRQRWRFETRMLYFGRRPAAESLLRSWAALCQRFPAVDEEHLLDQAWCLVTSQASLDTVWLPATDPVGQKADDGIVVRRAHRGMVEMPDSIMLAEPAVVLRLKTARKAERTGAPELLIAARSPSARRAVAVIHDIGAHRALDLAMTVEALASAFTADPGDFGQLEVIVCERGGDLPAALHPGHVDCVLTLTPATVVTADSFRRLADTTTGVVVAAPPSQVFDIAHYRQRRPNRA